MGERVGERVSWGGGEGKPSNPSLRHYVFPTLPLPMLLSPYPLPLQSPPATLALPIFNSLASPSIQFHQHQCTRARASHTHVHSLHMHVPLPHSLLPSLLFPPFIERKSVKEGEEWREGEERGNRAHLCTYTCPHMHLHAPSLFSVPLFH